MNEQAVLALLGIMASLVAVLTYVVKASLKRLEIRETQLERTLATLEAAVSAFRTFEANEDEVHAQLITRLDEHQRTQLEILRAIERLSTKIETIRP